MGQVFTFAVLLCESNSDGDVICAGSGPAQNIDWEKKSAEQPQFRSLHGE